MRWGSRSSCPHDFKPEAGRDALLEAYAEELRVSYGHAQHAMVTDLFMAHSMREWASMNARHVTNTYVYYMSHVPRRVEFIDRIRRNSSCQVARGAPVPIILEN